MIEDKEAPDPEVMAELGDRKRVLSQAIDRLPEKEKLLIQLYYYEGLTAKEISVLMGLSQSRISQLHTKAVFRLRGYLQRHKNDIA
jgi:RNA polymerase sigma factor for flagellar operon FliA